MHRNPYASLAPSEPRFQRPVRASREDRTDSDSGSGFKRAEGSGSGSGFKRADGSGFKRADGSGFKREEGSGFKRADGSGFKREEGSGSGFKREEFKRADGSGSGFKRADGGTLKGEASPFNANSESAFPALGGQERKPRQAPVWVKGQDTAKVIERALQVKTPPPPPVARILEDFLPLEASYSSSDEDDYIPTFEGGGGWGESSWDD